MTSSRGPQQLPGWSHDSSRTTSFFALKHSRLFSNDLLSLSLRWPLSWRPLDPLSPLPILSRLFKGGRREGAAARRWGHPSGDGAALRRSLVGGPMGALPPPPLLARSDEGESGRTDGRQAHFRRWRQLLQGVLQVDQMPKNSCLCDNHLIWQFLIA